MKDNKIVMGLLVLVALIAMLGAIILSSNNQANAAMPAKKSLFSVELIADQQTGEQYLLVQAGFKIKLPSGSVE